MTRRPKVEPEKPAEPKTHGGRRAGAGRPAVYDSLEDYHVYLDTASAAIVEARMAAHGENFSAAVRAILAAYALAQKPTWVGHHF